VSKWIFGGSCEAKERLAGVKNPTYGPIAENAESAKFTSCACVRTTPTGDGEEERGDAERRRRRSLGKTVVKSESAGPPSPAIFGFLWSIISI